MKRFLLCSLLSLWALPALAGTDPEALVRNMRPVWKRVTDFTADLRQQEAVNKHKSTDNTVSMKFEKPFRIYAKYISGPAKGREALYQGKDWNSGKIKVTNGKFPNITVNIDPFSKKATEKKHHPITHMGFDYIINIAIGQVDLAKKNNELDISSTGAETIGDRGCTMVELKLNAKAGQTVNPQKGDTFNTLAERYHIDAAVLKHNNAEIDPSDPKSSVWVPTYYGSKLDACVDDATGLPIEIKVWDHNGDFYEEFTFTKLKINVGLTDLDFDPENADYDF